MKEVALICGLSSGLFGLASAIALLKGAKVMPWEMQTFDGKSDAENAFRADAEWWNKLGIVFLLLAFGFSTLSAIAGYFA